MKFKFIGFHSTIGSQVSTHDSSSEANEAAREMLRGFYDQDNPHSGCPRATLQVLNLNGSIRVVGEKCQDVQLYYNRGRLVGVVAPELDSGEQFDSMHAMDAMDKG